MSYIYYYTAKHSGSTSYIYYTKHSNTISYIYYYNAQHSSNIYLDV